jgi:DHA3 family tetracycline resistance protein-like MFS transporter
VSLLVYYGPWEVLVPYVVKNTLGGTAGDLGLVFAAGGLGAMVAAAAMGHRALPRRHMTFMYATWAVGMGAMALFGVATQLWHAMVAAFLGGGLSTAGMVVWATLMQRRVPRHLLGRVTALDWLVSIGLIPVSFALTGPLAGLVGAPAVLIGGGILGAVLTAAFLFLPGMRASERQAPARAD